MLKRRVLAFALVGCGALGAEAADAPLQQIADTLDVSTLDLTVTTCGQQFLFSNYLPLVVQFSCLPKSADQERSPRGSL